MRLFVLRLLESYFRHRWLYPLPVIIMLAAGVLYVTSLPPQYTAQASLYTQKRTLLTALAPTGNESGSWSTAAQLTVSELRGPLQTEAFVRSAIQPTPLEVLMGSDPAQNDEVITYFRETLQFYPVGENLVTIYATDEDPITAQQIVASTVETYIQWKINADQQESTVAQGFFAELIEPYQQDLQQARDDLETYLLDRPEPIRGERPEDEVLQIAQLQSAVDLAESRVQSALDKEESARLAMAKVETDIRQSYLLVDAPDVPTTDSVSLRDLAQPVVLFLVIGIALSVGGVVGGALLDRTFRLALDVQHGLNLPVPAIIPEATRSVQAEAINQVGEVVPATIEHNKDLELEYGMTAVQPVAEPR